MMVRTHRSRLAVMAAAAIGVAGGALAMGTIPSSSAAPVPAPQLVKVANTPLPVTGSVKVANLPVTQNVSGTVRIDPVHNQVTETFVTASQPYSGDLPGGQTITLANGAINVGSYKEMTVVVGSDSPGNIEIRDAASGWILDSFATGISPTVRHYDYLPDSLIITIFNPNALDMQWNVNLYLRGN